MNPLDYAQRIAYSSKETLQFTAAKAALYKNYEGCYVECGVAAGAQIIAMLHEAPHKIVWAFDSFEGIPLPSNRDYERPGIRPMKNSERMFLPNPGEQEMVSSGITCVPEEDFKNHLISAGVNISHLKIVKGWFEDTLPNNTVEDILILRLDGDLYNSTLVCLKYLFPKVIEGGIVIIDDWQLQGCRDACIDYFNSIKYQPKYESISNITYFYK